MACELRAIHVDPHRRRQLQWRLLCTRLDGVIYVKEAAMVHLRDMYDSHLAMPLMAVPIAITFCKTQRNYLRYG
jgi:hypothetical protein